MRVQDSNGTVDTLRTNRAAIGSAYGGSLSALSVSPNVLPPATPTLVRIRGSGFVPGARVTLRNAHADVEASEVIALTPGELAATLSPPPSGDSYDLTVSTENTSSVSNEGLSTAQTPADPSLPRPSNATAGIRMLDLHADQTLAVNVVNFSLPYPTSLTSDSLLVTRPALSDTMALFRSRPANSIEFNGGLANSPSFVDYKVAPPQYTTSIGLMQMAEKATSGPAGYNDYDVPIVRVRALYSDGDSSVVQLKVGRQIRNYKTGTISCPLGPILQFYTQFPDDPLTALIYDGSGMFLDAQEVPLAPSKRTSKLQSIRISELPIIYTGCSMTGTTAAQSILNGISVWPSFEITNRHDQGVQLQKQSGAYGMQAYGGYVLRDTLFGAHGTIGSSGCFLSCMAMANTYFGNAVTVPELDKYLALNKGYSPTTVVTLDHVNGQDPGSTVSWTVKGDKTLVLGDTILVETRGTLRTSPLVTLRVGPTVSQGTIILWHRSGTLAPGMEGVGYDVVRSDVAADAYSQSRGHPWELTELDGSSTTLPPLVEQALADSFPVLLREPHHFLLASGWRPSFGATFANGTYAINDPGHGGVARLNQNFQVGAKLTSYANSFLAARSCVPLEQGHFSVSSAGSGSVAFVLQGGGHLSITDPQGHGLDFVEPFREYGGNIPNAVAWTDYGGWVDTETAPEEPVEYVELGGASAGDFRTVVIAAQTGVFGLTASTEDGSGNTAKGYAEYPLSVGQAAIFNVHIVQGTTSSVRIDTVGTMSVGGMTGPRSSNLLVEPNPSRGDARLVVDMLGPGYVKIQVFDIAGRLVATPLEGPVSGGRHIVQLTRMTRQAGLYFVKMTAEGQCITRRFLVTG